MRDSLKSYLLPLLNAWSFFSIYASIDGFAPAPSRAARTGLPLRPSTAGYCRRSPRPPQKSPGPSSQTRSLAATVALESFVDGLTNWYIRRSRRRFWSAKGGTGDADKAAAYWTLWEVLTSLAKLSAPFTPFLSDRMHQELVRPFSADAPVSIHLDSWPETAPVDKLVLEVGWEEHGRAANLGHGARQEAAIGVRQPLRRANDCLGRQSACLRRSRIRLPRRSSARSSTSAASTLPRTELPTSPTRSNPTTAPSGAS